MTAASRPLEASPRERVRLHIRGVVQGVGFRPSVYRRAKEIGLGGFVANSPAGVTIEAEGAPEAVARFVRLVIDAPPDGARIAGVEAETLTPTGDGLFEVRASAMEGERTATVLPDLATCEECLSELLDPADRRYRYPFVNCTHCGPRYSIVEDLPYDRSRTSMRRFPMCAACQAEYDDPGDRRFHAEPNACPVCGPKLALWDASGAPRGERDAALLAAGEAIRAGAIVAVKGLGGFHLIVDARNEAAVRRLRERKVREEKPFAVMFPSLAAVEAECRVSDGERTLLTAPQRPIVLVRRADAAVILPRAAGEGDHAKHGGGGDHGSVLGIAPSTGTELGFCRVRHRYLPNSGKPELGAGPPPPLRGGGSGALAPSVAPRNPYVGAMLAYTPLHHLLLADLGFPVVATSGNRSDEPIVTDERDAVAQLAGIADLFLVHDRPIVRAIDDSVVRIVAGRPMILRRARGYAPAAAVEKDMPEGILALGGHLKSALALSTRRGVILGQHVGDLDTGEARDAFDRARDDIVRLHAVRPRLVVRDLHPDYHSSRVAEASGLPVVAVQHHLAHVAACMAEHGLAPPALGVAWDGTGYGPDGTVWGGEFLLVTEAGWRRVAHLRPFRLPGGEAAVREPRRSAFGLLFAAFGREALAMTDLAPVAAFGEAERATLAVMLERGVNAPVTTSAGRLFDAVAALVGLRQKSTYEGQAAAELEWAIVGGEGPRPPRYRAVPPPRSGEGLAPLAASTSPSTEVVHGAASKERKWKALSLPGTGRGDHAKHGGRGPSPQAYSLPSVAGDRASPLIIDWEPALREILADIRRGASVCDISRAFHLGLAGAIADVAARVGEKTVVLTGGCFQNAVLTEAAIDAVRGKGLTPYWHQAVPTNDGGLALGQAMWAARTIERGEV